MVFTHSLALSLIVRGKQERLAHNGIKGNSIIDMSVCLMRQ